MESIVKVQEERKPQSIFKNKNFILLFLGKLVSQLGDVIYNMAIGWYILTITNSALQMSIYMAIGTVVYVIMGPIGGVIADRHDRKMLIIWMDYIRGAAVALTGVLMYLNIQSIYMLYITSAILSICGAIFVPASNALIPNIVEKSQLTKANSMSATIQSISGIVGLVAGGVLYALIGIKAIFVLNAVSYVICGILENFIILPKDCNKQLQENMCEGQSSLNNKEGTLIGNMVKELLESYKYIRNEKGFFSLIMFSTVINFILTPVFAIYVPYIFNQVLKTSPQRYSFVSAAFSIGFLLGAAIVSLISKGEKVNKLVRLCNVGITAIIAAMYIVMKLYLLKGISSFIVLILFIILFLALGATLSMMNIPLMVVVQKIIPNEMLGRISALLNTLSMLAMPLGMIIGGTLTDILAINVLLFVTAIVYGVITVYLCVNKDISKI